jgi:hypothetical protein
MPNNIKVRRKWLKFMYIYTTIFAGYLGLQVIFFPEAAISWNKFSPQDPMMFGVVGSVWISFAIFSIFGLRSPLKFIPVLLMQLFYKSIWLVAVVLPLLFAGKLSLNEIYFAIGMFTYVIGDLIAIPFPYAFSRET